MKAWLLLAVLAASAEGAPEWRQVADGDVKVFARTTPGQRVAEIKADMLMRVTPAEVRAVLLDENYTRHAPYVGEYRTLDSPAPMTWIRYTRLALPVVDDRDYFIEIHRDSDLAEDGSGTYHATWKPWGLDRPGRKGIIRVTVNSGYWDVKPGADGRAQVEYYLQFDPGGAIPAWAVDQGNKRVLPDVLHALEKEALRRRDAK